MANIIDVEENKWYEFSLQTSDGLTSVMILKKPGKYYGFKNSCPHQGRRMDYAAGKFLLSETGNIICPAHGAEFDCDSGLCINGPCLGQSLVSVNIQTNETDIFAIIK
ncbi:MAG: Rieske (2Fe-2S) protein [Alcanivoracaceae bacterium]|nr:Rieske (2Fe-2S) protein [Alcanivoracaceae bacterium]